MAENIVITPAAARDLFDNGGTLVFLDVPTGTEFGIDYNSWTVGPKFKGVKMIPPGVHFIYYSAVSQTDAKQVAPRTAFFYDFKPQEVLIKKWNKVDEDISMVATSAEEQATVEANKQDMDRFLGAYPYENYEKWVSLTDHISYDLVKRLQPSSGKICSVSQFESELSTSQSRKEAAQREKEADAAAALVGETNTTTKQLDSDGLPNMKKTPGTEFGFSAIPKKKYPDGVSATEISHYSMDYSFIFSQIIKDSYGGNDCELLGELQFAFICFILGQVYEGFEQWKTLVNLFSFSEKAISDFPELFNKFIGVLHFHVKEIPEDFFVDIVAQNNFLVGNLRNFFRNTEDCDVIEVKERASRFRKHLEKKFKWDLSVEDDEYEDGPVVVDMD